jgi:dienelactone hydrolase
MKKKFAIVFFLALLVFQFHCATTGGQRISTNRLYQISNRLFDMESRGEDVRELNAELEKCWELIETRKTKEAEAPIQSLIETVNGYYQKPHPSQYVFENVRYRDIYVETSQGSMLGFIAEPEKEGKFPGILLLKGANSTSFTLKRIGHRLAAQGYVCLLPDFNDDFSMNGVIDLKKWLRVFENHPRLDTRSMAVISYSRGSLYAYRLIQHGYKFQAWVTYFGVLFPTELKEEIIQNNPVPVLILHGKKDRECPIEWAYNLEEIYRNNGLPIQTRYFENERHGFSREGYTESRELVDKFFESYLNPGK